MTPAAVLVPLINRPAGVTVMLTQRTAHLTDHAGQISFPGGRVDEGDLDRVYTALREAEEETGLTRLLPYGTLHPREPFDLDIHDIPERKQEPQHLHYDLRYLFLADPEERLVPETSTLQLACCWAVRTSASVLSVEPSSTTMTSSRSGG